MAQKHNSSLKPKQNQIPLPHPIVIECNVAVIPLKGGGDPTIGKQPAVAWSIYQQRLPTAQELHQWFEVEERLAYGVVCGQTVIVLDLDSSEVAKAFRTRFPALWETFVVRSGVRGTPHLYWQVDFEVKSQRVLGGDLKGQGSYVVGPGSTMGEHEWTVLQDLPIRPISRGELLEVLAFLDAPALTLSPALQVERNPMSITDVRALYQRQVRMSGQRNNSLFQVACLARDHGHSCEWTKAALSDYHASMRPASGQPTETYDRRHREAVYTITSAYSRPPRMINLIKDQAPASRLPNALRKTFLQRDDGPAILRVLEGLLLKGVTEGDELTEKDMINLLKGHVGRHSVRRTLQATLPDDIPLFQAFVRQFPTNKNAVFCSESEGLSSSALARGDWGEQTVQRPPRVFVMPNIEELCELLNVSLMQGDRITLTDIATPCTYRQAMEYELIRRRPGAYAQTWLAQRLGISDRTIRRYHKKLGIQSRRRYIDQALGWWNIYDLLPTGDETGGGRCLMDETGKTYPAIRSVALPLLKAGRKLIYRVQSWNTYWIGPAEPDWLALAMQKEGYEKQLPAVDNQLVVPDKPQQAEPIAIKPIPEGEPEVENELIYVRRLDPPPPPPPDNPSARFFQQALPDPEDERVAARVYQAIDDLSQANARRLVHLYGRTVVEPVLRRVCYLIDKGKVYNPAGFFVTAVQADWRTKHGWHEAKPVFKAQPVRRRRKRFDVMKDPLSKSEKWLRWRVWFAYEMGDEVSVERWQARLIELGYEPEKLFDWMTSVECEISF